MNADRHTTLFIAFRIASICLLIGAYARWPIGYYSLLRLVVCGTCIYGALYSIKAEKVFWITTMILVALLYQPLSPFYLKKTNWETINALTAVFFGTSLYFLRSIPSRGETEEEKKKREDPYHSIFWGQLLILGAVAFWYGIGGNPFHDFAIIQRGQTVPGQIIEAWEDSSDDDRGKTHFYHQFRYSYRLPDGREFTQETLDKQGRLPDEFLEAETHPIPIEVEYVPDDPEVSRIKGDGAQTLSDWLTRKIGAGTVLLIMFLSPGIYMLREGIVGLKRRSTKQAVLRVDTLEEIKK